MLRGLVMNRARLGDDEVILIRYTVRATSQQTGEGGTQTTSGDGCREIEEKDWFISDEEKLMEMGYDVQGMKKWWVERTAASMDRAK